MNKPTSEIPGRDLDLKPLSHFVRNQNAGLLKTETQTIYTKCFTPPREGRKDSNPSYHRSY
jgi:hypothetical protein